MYLCFTFFNKVINSYNSITFNSIFIIQNNIKILMCILILKAENCVSSDPKPNRLQLTLTSNTT